ncbi:MAG: hypothetical protein HRU15_19660, partial [Planctomycetes bacterium]|nr:hypothetical protein [Planctomycetota bacterium]
MLTVRSFTYTFLLSFALCSALAASEFKALKLTEQGEGLNHRVIIEAPHVFRIAFENKLNYGLSQWFDLSNRQQKDIDISQNHTDYLPIHEQGALFNQCLNPHDLIGHV